MTPSRRTGSRRRRPGRAFLLVALLAAASCSDAPQESHLDRALRLQAEGDFESAIWEIHAAVAAAPDDAGLRRRQGLIYLDAGDAAAAEGSFRHAIELGAGDDDIHIGLARTLFLQDKHAPLLEQLDATRFSSPQAQWTAEVLRGKALNELNDPERARRVFLRLLKQLDLESFRRGAIAAADERLGALEAERDRYAALDAALEYRHWLFNLPVGEWTELHKQAVKDAVFFSRQNHGGSAFDTKRGRLVLFGSDTHDYGDIAGKDWKNNLFFFDPAIGEWSQSYPKDAPQSYTVDAQGLPVAGEHGDHPWAMHTYGAVAYDERRDQIVVASHPAHLEPGRFTYMLAKVWPQIKRHPTWLYDLGSERWLALEAPGESFFQFAVDYDADRGVVIGYKDTGVYELAGEPRTWRQVADKGLLGPDNNVVYDARHKALVVFGSQGRSNDVAVYEPASGRHRIMPTPGTRPPADRHAPMAFHPRIGKTVVLVQRRDPDERHATGGTTQTWLYDLGADAWQQVETATLDSGIFRNYNLEYDPLHDLLLFIPNPYGPFTLTTVLALRFDAPRRY